MARAKLTPTDYKKCVPENEEMLKTSISPTLSGCPNIRVIYSLRYFYMNVKTVNHITKNNVGHCIYNVPKMNFINTTICLNQLVLLL